MTSKEVNEFLAGQLQEWPQAKGNYEALAGVEVKDLDVDGMHIKVQFNPARAVSSSAKVDAKSLRERKCFLCAANRPDVQRGIEWGPGGRYVVLVNPFPIFPRHLTIPDQTHTDQLIVDRVEDMFDLAGELDEYTVFYNGPKCGASAPDHMHFQAGNSDFLTVKENLAAAPLKELARDGEATLSVTVKSPLNMFVIDAKDHKAGARLFKRLYAAMPVKEDETEPMMNVLCYHTDRGERMVVIPRKKHRPSFYGTEGDGCMLMSPASVDMGGVFITPRLEDYVKVDADIIRSIFDELCLSAQETAAIADKIK